MPAASFVVPAATRCSCISLQNFIDKAFVLKPESVDKYEIRLYKRYRDDIVSILGGTQSSRIEFFRMIKRRAR